MKHKFQRKVPSVGGRLSPWVDEEEWRATQNSQILAKNLPNTVENPQTVAEPVEEKTGVDPYWPRRKKSFEVTFTSTLNISSVLFSFMNAMFALSKTTLYRLIKRVFDSEILREVPIFLI